MVREPGDDPRRAREMTTGEMWRPTLPLVVIGGACIVAGGLVAAFSASSPSENASWSAAYLVLVAGVAQVGLAAGQAMLAARPLTVRWAAAELAGWNGGNAAVIAGTLTGSVPLVDAGGALLVVALALVIIAARGNRPGNWVVYGFRGLVLVLLVSIPVGLVLARIGA